jgi:hypothetical protein
MLWKAITGLTATFFVVAVIASIGDDDSPISSQVESDFLTVPDQPAGEGLRSEAYEALASNDASFRAMVAQRLIDAGYPNAARHIQ